MRLLGNERLDDCWEAPVGGTAQEVGIHTSAASPSDRVETPAEVLGNAIERVADLGFRGLSFLRQRTQAETGQDHPV